MMADIVNLAQVRAAKFAPPLNAREVVSIQALLAYTAHENKVSEDLVRKLVSERFGVAEVTNLPATLFEDVIRFLVDLQVDLLMN